MPIEYDVKMRRRTLAIVLLDLIGSTRFVQKVGAVRAAKHFQIHDRLARSLIYKYNGREIDRSDGFLCSFETTSAAVNFALAYQSTIPGKIGLGTRIGIHWGTIVEVQQDELYVAINAKRIELEGLAKNIAARTMSLCSAGQVLLTSEAMDNVRRRPGLRPPKGTRFACIGLYKFKGVREPQSIYAVGESLQSLQPPLGGPKVKRLGGPKSVKSRARDRKIKEWFWWLAWRVFWVEIIIIIIYCVFPVLASPTLKTLWGITGFEWVEYMDTLLQKIGTR